jgi:hypothetical protein
MSLVIFTGLFFEVFECGLLECWRWRHGQTNPVQQAGCHLCEGLQENCANCTLPFALEIRDIAARDDWFQAYQYEVPVLVLESDD